MRTALPPPEAPYETREIMWLHENYRGLDEICYYDPRTDEGYFADDWGSAFKARMLWWSFGVRREQLLKHSRLSKLLYKG